MALTDYTLQSPPRISPAQFAEVLRLAGSPALAENVGDALWHIVVSYGLDPAIALAFFQHESSYGKAGLARVTQNWGNVRRSPSGRGVVRTIPGRGPFAHYQSWADSLRDWCEIILGPVYIGNGLTTVSKITPVYAPSSDGNRPASYARAVNTAVATWEALTRDSGWSPSDPWASWGSAYPLDPAARGFAIPQRWRTVATLGAAIGPEQSLGPGRAAQAFERGVVVWLGGERTEVLR